jgi:hypothetical protein
VLTSQPTATVQITLDPGSQVTVGPPHAVVLLLFTTANWNVPQTVTVTAVDDTVAEGPHTGTIAFAVNSANHSFDGQAIPSITVSIADNDTAGIVVSPTSGLETTEAGGTATFMVRLASVPTAIVAIPVSSSNISEGTVSASSLTFHPDTSALAPQTVTVTGRDDQVSDGDVAYTIVLGAATSSDPSYGGLNPPDVGVTNRDDDSSGTVGFTATAASVSESAGQVTLTVQRGTSSSSPSSGTSPNRASVGAASLAPVTVSYATANGTATAGQDYQPTSGTLTFGLNETSKSIVVPILSDDQQESAETFTVTLSAPTGGAALGAGTTVTVTIEDTTGPPLKPQTDDSDKPRKETEDERRQREHTNTGNRDDVYTEGNVVEVHQDEQQDGQPPYVVIGNRDGLVKVVLLCKDQCPTVQVGDYLEAEGTKQNEQLFEATDVTVDRR